jgi:hypothetical protein
MSDTQAGGENQGIPNFSAETVKLNWNGKDVDGMRFTFGEPRRTITTQKLGLGDEFDLIGMAGDLSNNSKWMIMAGLAFSVCDIDGLPIPRPTNLIQLRAALDRIGVAGLSAYIRAVGALATDETAVVTAAKN